VVGIFSVIVALAVVLAIVYSVDRNGSPSPAANPSAANPSAKAKECAGKLIDQTFKNGAVWSMCWSIDPYAGLVLSHISFGPAGGHDPIPIISTMSLGQLQVPYDTGLRETADITSQGFGGRDLQSISTAECTGTIHSAYVPNYGDGKIGGGQNRPVLCTQVDDTGLAFRSNHGGTVVAGQGQSLVVSTISKVGWYEYVDQYSFTDEGMIAPELGATGTLSPSDYTTDPAQGSPLGPGDTDRAASHTHNAVWKVHWDLGGSGALRALEYNAAFNGKQGPKSPEIDGEYTTLTRETKRDLADRRWWEVENPGRRNADGHPISYEIDLGATDSYATGATTPVTDGPDYDVAFTQYKSCEQFASFNRDPGCPGGVDQYVSDHQQLTDVVSWVAVGFHHVPRDEDQAPMEVHWQGFSMMPRDLSAQRPDPPKGYASDNGRAPG
jgi:primary-amine oxidase